MCKLLFCHRLSKPFLFSVPLCVQTIQGFISESNSPSWTETWCYLDWKEYFYVSGAMKVVTVAFKFFCFTSNWWHWMYTYEALIKCLTTRGRCASVIFKLNNQRQKCILFVRKCGLYDEFFFFFIFLDSFRSAFTSLITWSSFMMWLRPANTPDFMKPQI